MRLFILLFFVILQSCNSNTSKNNSNLSIGNDAKIDTNTAKKEADSNYSATKPKETEKKNWTYIDPDTLNIIREVFVIAKGGLTYREKPDITSRKISVFDYGKKLSIIEETGIPFKVKDGEEIIEGKWVKAVYIDYRYKQELLSNCNEIKCTFV